MAVLVRPSPSPGPMCRGASDKLVVTPISAVGQSHIWWRPGTQASVFQLPFYTEQARNQLNEKSPLAQAQKAAAFPVVGLSKTLPNQGIPVPPQLSRCSRVSSEWGMLFSPRARSGCLSVPIKGYCLTSCWAGVCAVWKLQPRRNPWQVSLGPQVCLGLLIYLEECRSNPQQGVAVQARDGSQGSL